MGIRKLVCGFSLTALVAAAITVPTVAQAGDVKIHLHGHFIGHNYGHNQQYGHRQRHRHNHGHYYSAPRHRYGYSYGRRHYDSYPRWYGRKRHYGHRSHRYHNPGTDRRSRKHQRRQARRGFSDVVVPQPKRKRR